MKYYVIYCNDGTPSIEVTKSKKLMDEWVLKFLFETQNNSGSWIDYMIKGEMIRSEYKLDG